MSEVVVTEKSELSTQELHDVLSDIAAGMRKVVNATIETAIIISQHQGKDYWVQVEDALLNKVQWFDPSVLSMYKKIGANAALRIESNREKLPPSYNTLYHLAFSDPDRLNRALEKGQINPKTTLAQAKQFSGEDKKKAKSSTAKETEALSVSVSIKFPDKTGKVRLAKNALASLKMEVEKSGGTVKWSDF